MKKIQCPNIKKGENVHVHYCPCCEGNQHIPFAKALKYELRGLLVLSDNGNKDASDSEMFYRIENFIAWYKYKHNYNGKIKFDHIGYGEPIATLNNCISSLKFKETK